MLTMIGLGFLGAGIFALLGATLILYVQNAELKRQNRKLRTRIPQGGWAGKFDLEVTRLEKSRKKSTPTA